jgi:cytochrome P450
MAIGESVQRTTTHAGEPAWLATGYETVKGLLGDDRMVGARPEPGQTNTLLSAQGDHQQMRRLLTPAFSAKRIARLRPRVRELVDGMLDDMARRNPPVDLHETLSFPLPAFVICEVLGVPFEDREDFRRWSDDAEYMDRSERSQAGQAALWQYMHRLIERKREEPGIDVLSDLVAVSDADPAALPPDRVAMIAMRVLFTGHKTTADTIDKGVLLVFEHPEVRARLDDPRVVDGAVEEIMRSAHPVPNPGDRQVFGMIRYASEDVDVDGVTIPAGDMVMLSLRSANLDGRTFADPETFDPAREGNNHLGFGFGAHFCLGAPLARLQLRAVFGSLFTRFPTLRLAVPLEDIRRRTGMMTGGIEALPVTW